MEEKGTVCVTGAAGFVGSSLVKCLLEQGYTVKATVRDPRDLKKVKHLLDLPNASTRISLWKAELCEDGSFDDAIRGCLGVFHVATPTDFTVIDPENETIKPAIKGVVNILKSCMKSSTVRRVIYTSSAGAVCAEEHRKQMYDEDCWSDVEFCKTKKMVGWNYFASKTLAEKAGFEFAESNSIDFVSIIPTLVNGSFFMPTLPPSMLTALALIARNAPHYPALNPIQFNHIYDLCQAHIFLFEHPKAKGRYICSSHDITLPNLATMLRERYPQYNIPTEFEGVTEFSELIKFSSKKLIELGFHFKYSLEDMFDGAIHSCIEKGLLPLENKKDEVI